MSVIETRRHELFLDKESQIVIEQYYDEKVVREWVPLCVGEERLMKE